MKRQQSKGYLMILTAGILWGSIGFFVRILTSLGVESSTAAFLRIAAGAVILIPMMLAAGGAKLFQIDRKGLAICAVLGVLCQALFNFCYTESIQNVGVATGSVLLYTSPVFVCIMSFLFFHEQIGWIKLTALAVNIAGSILTVTGGDFSAVRFSVYGAAAGVAAGFLYALMTIISAGTGKYHSMTVIFYSFLFGSAALAVIRPPWGDIMESVSPSFVLAALGYGLIPTAGSYYFYMKGLACNPETSKVPVVASVETVAAAVIGIAVFGEEGGLLKLAGICCVILSILIMNLVRPGEKTGPAENIKHNTETTESGDCAG